MDLQVQYYKDDKKDKISKRVFTMLVYILLVVFFVFTTISFVFQTRYKFILVNGVSMQNTLNDKCGDTQGFQDGVYVRLTKDVDYNDIIVLEKVGEETTIIKRAMAFEGDKITIAKLEIDGEESFRFMRMKRGSNELEVLDESEYIKSYEDWDKGQLYETVGDIKYEKNFYQTYLKNGSTVKETYQGVEYEFAVVGEGRVYYMGDNRARSKDCRETGTAPHDKIVGRVVKIAHNVYSAKNSPFFLFNYLSSYLSVIWNDIIDYFTFKA